MWPARLCCLCLALAAQPLIGQGSAQLETEAAPDPGSQNPQDPSETTPTFEETVVVTASRREETLTEAVAFTSVVGGETLRRSPSPTLDGVLRQVPGFSLFRRSGSLSSHPTTQGVSLRGIGPSGTSRSLVLFDGMPLNDPFGGWVIWNRYPASLLDRLEIVRGAGSAVWGSAALGGTIQLLPRTPAAGTLEVALRAGGGRLRDAEVFASGRPGAGGSSEAWGWTVSGRGLDTEGFFLLAPEDRGAADRPAGVGLATLIGRLARDGSHGGIHGGVHLYRETRGNGTALQENQTRLAVADLGFAGARWSWSVHGQRQRFESTFSRVLPGRGEEILTARQDVPSTSLGGSLVFRSADGRWVGGADGRRVGWEGSPEGDLRQTLPGLFAQRTFRPAPRLEVLAGARLDRWDNRSAQTSFSPRLGAVFEASPGWILRGSAYRGFRAPTLNELYRPFRVGNVLTAANPELTEERLTGVEAGGDWVPAGRRGRPVLRLNAFLNRLDDPVGNATVEVTPERILRQRRNLGRVRVRGVEIEGSASLARRWRLEAAYLLSDAEVEATGLPLPQAARHQASLRLTGGGPLRLVVEGRWASEAYEDDRAELSLGSLAVLDAALSAPLGRRLEVFAAVENLLDRSNVTGRLPEERLGAPRRLTVGVRWRRPRTPASPDSPDRARRRSRRASSRHTSPWR
jgi:outer membrane cobalamin receptor